MALCANCGISVGSATKCPKCGSDNLKNLDRNVFGISQVPDRRTVEGDWDAAAEELVKEGSKESLKEVKREAKKRRRYGKGKYQSGNWGSWQTKFLSVIGIALIAFILFHRFI
jgi:hypothetical protein